jgi:hypothetical protein
VFPLYPLSAQYNLQKVTVNKSSAYKYVQVKVFWFTSNFTLKMEAAKSSETLASYHKTT